MKPRNDLRLLISVEWVKNASLLRGGGQKMPWQSPAIISQCPLPSPHPPSFSERLSSCYNDGCANDCKTMLPFTEMARNAAAHCGEESPVCAGKVVVSASVASSKERVCCSINKVACFQLNKERKHITVWNGGRFYCLHSYCVFRHVFAYSACRVTCDILQMLSIQERFF